MHMLIMCWNYEHGTMDDPKMGIQCIFVCVVWHLFTWYANEMYAYALKDIFFFFFYNVVIVMNYYYIQGNVRVNDANSLPFVP